MGRYNVSMPDELWEAVRVEADRSAGGNKSFVVRRALEAALGETPRSSPAGREAKFEAGDESPVRPGPAARQGASEPASPRASAAYKCPRGCVLEPPPSSPNARCGSCGRTVVPA